MKYVVSRYNHDISWLPEYTDDIVLYDRSEQPMDESIVVQNIGSDIFDKLTFIIDNYSDLPEIAVYTKANLFKYITKQEFDLVKDNTIFTPLFTQSHKETFTDMDAVTKKMIPEIEEKVPNPEARKLFYRLNRVGETGIKPYSFYDTKGMYHELNLPAYLSSHPPKSIEVIEELMRLLGIWDMEYIPFAPGSNYILPKANILKHTKEFYEKLRSYIDWGVYPGECMIIERGLYTLWK